MGSIFNELKRSSLGRALKNALGDTQANSALERFGETLTPTIDLWSLPEWAFLRDERLLASGQQQAAVAAQFGSWGVGIPPAVDVIAVVEEIRVATAVAAVFAVERLTHAQLAAGVATLGISCETRDRRGGEFGRIELFSGTSVTATLGQELERWNGPANESTVAICALPYVLFPGQAIVLICQTALTLMNSSIKLRERPRLMTERT